MAPKPVKVIVEIERHSNQKWEYDHQNDRLFLDRVLKYPYFYPYAYGFFPRTLGDDGDELDMLLITETTHLNYNSSRVLVEGYIVGGLLMHDEKGEDSKIFVVPVEEFEQYNQKSVSEIESIEDDIRWFFSNYKSKDIDKWSRVEYLLNKDEAVEMYKKSVAKYGR